MLASMVPASVANAEAEAAVLAEAAARDGVELAPWDWAFYGEQVRAERYAVDTAALRPYFELDRVLVDGVFHAAELLYGFRFTPRPDLAGYHPDVRVWEVRDADGAAVGLYLGDFFAREGKRGGAWMSSFVRQSRLLGTAPVVVNNLNVLAAAGRPADAADARRGEHPLPRVRPRAARPELGGHLPAVLRHQRARATSSSSPARSTRCGRSGRRCCGNYARHVETGEPLPAAASRRSTPPACGARASRTLEYLAATLLDQAWHRITPGHRDRRPDRVRAAGAGRRRGRLRPRAAALPDDLLPARLRRGLRGRLLLLHLVGGARRRHRGVVQGERRPAPGERRRLPQPSCSPVGGSVDPLAAFRAVRGRDADPARCCAAAVSRRPDCRFGVLPGSRSLQDPRSREQHRR